MTMTGIICACMCCIYQPFILFWAHAGNMFPNQIMLLFVIYFFTERMGNICFQYRQASGLWSHDRIRPLVDGVTNLTLNYILVQRIGIAGVMLSTILCHIFIDSLWASSILFRYYFTKEKQSKYLLRLSFYALVTMIACTLTMAICRFLPMEGTNAFYSILFIFARAIICLCISSLLFYFSCRKLSEFSDAMAIVSRIVKRG